MNYQGVVSSISSFNYQGNLLWSFQLSGDKGTYFRTGSNAPKFEKGDLVNFVGEPGKNGSVNVNVKTIQSKKGDSEAADVGVANVVRSVRPSQNGSGSKDDYWVAREQRDISTQKRIERQSCRNSALEFMKLILDKGEFKLPAKNKVEALEEMLSHYQEKFLIDNSGEVKSENKTEPNEPAKEEAGYN